MENKGEKKPIVERIADLKKLIVATTDRTHVAKLLDQLLSLQRQADVEPVELIVPTKETRETLDFGAVKIMRTIRGYLVQCKGGMATFIENRMIAVCVMLNTLFELHNKERNEEEKSIYEAFREAVLYIFQAPIFASLSDELLFGIANDLLHRFREYAEPEQEITHEETEEDIMKNDETEQMMEGLETIVNAPSPPEV